MPCLSADAPDRITDSHREASPYMSPPHEADTVALEEQLEGTRITRKDDHCSQFNLPPSKKVAAGRQWASRSTITHTIYALQTLTEA